MTNRVKWAIAVLVFLLTAVFVLAQNMSIGETYLTHLSLMSQLSVPNSRAHVITFRDTGTVASAASATIWYQADPDGTGACTERLIVDLNADGTLGTTDPVLQGAGLIRNDANCDGTAGD